MNYRDKVSLEKPVQTKNSTTGSTVETWGIIVIRRARITPLKSSERAALGSEISESSIMVRLRYDSCMTDISNEWRVVDQRTGRIYDIEGFDPIVSGLRELKIRCVHRSK